MLDVGILAREVKFRRRGCELRRAALRLASAQSFRFCHPGGGLRKLKQREAAKLALRQVEVLG